MLLFFNVCICKTSLVRVSALQDCCQCLAHRKLSIPVNYKYIAYPIVIQIVWILFPRPKIPFTLHNNILQNSHGPSLLKNEVLLLLTSIVLLPWQPLKVPLLSPALAVNKLVLIQIQDINRKQHEIKQGSTLNNLLKGLQGEKRKKTDSNNA